jgi:WhiB family transcriptional regulator, redox-sensing transcriptional regulator
VTAWQDHAACKGLTELMFGERGSSEREAKNVCAGCPVRVDCLEYALVNNEAFGIWGGTSYKQRRKLRKDRAIVAAPKPRNYTRKVAA